MSAKLYKGCETKIKLSLRLSTRARVAFNQLKQLTRYARNTNKTAEESCNNDAKVLNPRV